MSAPSVVCSSPVSRVAPRSETVRGLGLGEYSCSELRLRRRHDAEGPKPSLRPEAPGKTLSVESSGRRRARTHSELSCLGPWMLSKSCRHLRLASAVGRRCTGHMVEVGGSCWRVGDAGGGVAQCVTVCGRSGSRTRQAGRPLRVRRRHRFLLKAQGWDARLSNKPPTRGGGAGLAHGTADRDVRAALEPRFV